MKDYREELKKYTDDADPFWDFQHLYRARVYSFGGSMVSAMVSAYGSVVSYFKHMRVALNETFWIFALAFTALWHALCPWIGGFSLIKLSVRHMESVSRFVPKHPEVVKFHLRMCEMYDTLTEEKEYDDKV